MSVQPRYVVLHHKKGVFLGVDSSTPASPALKWSKEGKHEDDATAPTFANGDDFEQYLHRNNVMLFPPNYHLRECWPRAAAHSATKEDIANAGLPVWGD